MTDDLCQFFTPLWAAECLVDRHFPDLDADDLVIEPSCGLAAFLRAIPAQVPALGVEIDVQVAAQARLECGREILVGDFRTIPLSVRPTVILGNPPFRADLIDGFLTRAHALLPDGGRVGFLLPTYFFQTAARVCRYTGQWSLACELTPRNAFHSRMRTPLLFAVFSKDRQRVLVGLSLYAEADALHRMAEPYRRILSARQGSAWKAVCQVALERLGGEAALSDLYLELERNRPTQTSWWREKIRQTLRVYPDAFRAIEPGRYALVEEVAA